MTSARWFRLVAVAFFADAGVNVARGDWLAGAVLLFVALAFARAAGIK